ncbi:MAG: hypothetical protein A2664_00010 [Candidatus Taylorbacteria bacterium RIFCSPHIGHO2_01_FULL_46_22b]|uniref:Uncharacterized protein n=1 Tax=Candidatus Taylorbacteria bacterium RIFCSPHIGHO2_01_FULL_46_22b TaxID=1802301 RepID=A0A1G2M2M9_9BACT|nr:MAG: hypothetical protein A2664_00010 [Candidatus Taylorbacteria bacterium RIFCSPHIGHO2_01_FULL_46_22b]
MIIVDVTRCPLGQHNYVVLENENGEVIIFSDDVRHFPSRKDLLTHYECESGLDARCLGGGLISIDYKNKVIHIREDGEEAEHEMDMTDIVLSLKGEYPEFNVTEG